MISNFRYYNRQDRNLFLFIGYRGKKGKVDTSKSFVPVYRVGDKIYIDRSKNKLKTIRLT